MVFVLLTSALPTNSLEMQIVEPWGGLLAQLDSKTLLLGVSVRVFLDELSI